MNLYNAFEETIKNDKNKIMKDFITNDLKPFVADAGKSTLSLVKLPYTVFKKIKTDGIVKSYFDTKESIVEFGIVAKNIPKNFQKASLNLFDQINQELNSRESTKDKTTYILKLLTYFTSFIIGIVAGHAFPDKDIKYIGIGKHRNIFTHSILLLIFVKVFSMFLLRVINEIDNKLDSDDENKETLGFLKNNLAAIASGSALGVSAHLVVDGVFQPTGTIRGPGFNTFVSGTLLDDQAFLLINSFFATLFGKELADLGKEEVVN